MAWLATALRECAGKHLPRRDLGADTRPIPTYYRLISRRRDGRSGKRAAAWRLRSLVNHRTPRPQHRPDLDWRPRASRWSERPAPTPSRPKCPKRFASVSAPPAAHLGASIEQDEGRGRTIGLLKSATYLAGPDLKPARSAASAIGRALKACEGPRRGRCRRKRAFLQVFVKRRRPRARQGVIGLLSRESNLKVVDHPIYEVWVKDAKCASRARRELSPAMSPPPRSAAR